MEPELFLESRGSLEEGAAISLGEGWDGGGILRERDGRVWDDSWGGMGR